MALSKEVSQEEDDEDARTLFCANLSEKATEAILYELFLQVGFNEKSKNKYVIFFAVFHRAVQLKEFRFQRTKKVHSGLSVSLHIST